MTESSVLRRADSLANAEAGVGVEPLADRLLQAAVRAARIGMWEFDLESSTVLATERVREIYGFGAGEPLTFELFTARIHEADRPAVLAKVQATLDGESDLYDIEHRVVWPDGSVRWVQVLGNAVAGEPGRGRRMLGTMVDVTSRKEAEQQLVANAQLLRQLIANTPAAVAMFDRDMRYLETSQRWVTDYHLEGVPLIGRSHYEVFPDQPQAWKDIHQRVLAGAVERCEEDPFPRQDGSTEWLQWEVQPWRDASGAIAGVIMFTQVITARKRAEEALQRAEEKFARVFWAAPVAICMTRVQDGLILDVNREFERLFGYQRAEAAGRTTVELGMWPDPEERRSLARNPLNPAGIPTVHEVLLRARDGTLIPVSNSAHPLSLDGELYLLSAFSDLSERRRSDAAIRASESRLRRVFASPIVGMAFVNADGNVSEANAECLRILGASAADVVHGRLNLRKLAPKEHQDAVVEALRASGELATKPREVELLRRDDTRAPIMLGVSSVDEDGARKIAFLFDLSERRRLERQLLHAQRMEAVGRLAAGIAHDFNNVLSAITMSAELLGEALPPGHAREDLRELRKATDRAVRLVRQLLTFSRQQVMEPRVLSLNELVANLENMLRRILGSDLELRSELTAERPEVKADPGQIEQVIMNLVVNARDAMPQGGTLTLRTENVLLEAERHLDVSLAPGPYVMLSVTDTGTGMDAATKTRMFEPFFTTKEQGKGTGLGLSTVYGIVRQSGGAIDVVSAPGSGTTLSVYLPRVAEAARTSLIPVAPETMGGSETILVVERDSVLRRTTRKLLVSLGYRVLDTESAAGALSLAQVYVGPIDLVLMDPGAPSHAGHAAIGELRALRPKLRVLLMATDAQDARRAMAERELGACAGVIQKPFASAGLARELRLLLDADIA